MFALEGAATRLTERLSPRAELGDHDVDNECSSSPERGEFRRRRAGTDRGWLGQPTHQRMEATMIRILDEILLFSCLAAFVTGIVVVAASLLS